MIEVVLVLIGLLWIVFASIQDLRSREVANWLNFSLIIFVLGIRFFYSLFEAFDFAFFYQGVIGLCIFLVLGNLFYYSRLFGGGDAKLMIALGAIFPLKLSLSENVNIFIWFLILFLVVGAIYGIIWSFVLMFMHFDKFKLEFLRLFNRNKKKILIPELIGVVLFAFGFFDVLFFLLGIMVLFLPYFYLYAKAIDNSCMIKKVMTNNLRMGDLLYKGVGVGKKRIDASWEGLSESEIKKIRKFVLIREGIPFVPVFLISYLILFYLYFGSFLFGF